MKIAVGNAGTGDKVGREEDAAFYDRLHASESTYDAPLERSIYSKLYNVVVEEVKLRKLTRILEVGCGSGALAKLISEQTRANYRGFDFSAVAVEKARSRLGNADAFFVADALSPDAYQRNDYDGVVCTEVLEHIENDLGVLKRWRSGAQCVCSVPNFEYEGHVRHFRSEEEVRHRYSSLMDIANIKRVARPIKSDVDWRAYFKRVRWMREKPRRMIGYLGIQTFERVGGWFVFSGRRK